MENVMKIIFITIGLFSVSTVVSSYENCISEFCFTLFNSSLTQNFDGAKSWCRNSASSQLISIGDNETRDTVWQFLNSSGVNSFGLIYIDMKLQQANPATWYLISGTNYNGHVDTQDNDGYRFYTFLIQDRGNWRIHASRPDVNQNFICEFNESICSTYVDANNTITYKGRCYIKYESENVSWYEARKRCISMGGDLASFNSSPTDSWGPDLSTSKLNGNLSYWVGIRRNNWSWISPSDNRTETLYDGWSVGKPNNIGYSCVCLDPNGSPQWSWTDCACDVVRSFLCLRKVATTTSTTTTTTTTPTTTMMTYTMSVKQNFTSSSTMKPGLTSDQKLIIGLVVGLGGALLIIIIIILIAVIFRRRKRKQNAGGERNIINSDALGVDSHKNKRTEVSGDYSLANSVTENAANADTQYAEVVVKSQPRENTETDESKSDILYTSFNQSLKSAKSCNSDDVDGVIIRNNSRSQTIYSPSSNEVYANAT